MEELKACPFCGKPLYIKIKRYTKPLLAPLTHAAALRDELIDITGEDYVPIQAVYCPICGHPLSRRAAPENKALTLEQLRQMDGEPVYIIEGDKQGYAIVNWEGASSLKHMYFSRTGTAEGMTAEPVFESGYGKTWTAYARRPEDAT